jgi:NAD(P)-dependent dehydrogenase (short-subunit alcohol dehydrogenase family)
VSQTSPQSPIDFSGQVAVVTGAGNGLGRECALELARRGASVVVNDLGGRSDGTGAGRQAADEAVAQIASTGGLAVASYDDVSTEAGAIGLISKALKTYGRVDALAHYAGIIRPAPIAEMSVTDFDTVLNVHVRGAFLVTREAFGVMLAQGYGRLLYAGSAGGMFGVAGEVNYGAAKGGMYGLMRSVALEGSDFGINANYLMPGAMTRLGEDSPALSNEVRRRLESEIGAALHPCFGSAMPAFLLSAGCEVTGRVFNASLGCFGEAFVGLTQGWLPDGEDAPTAEDLRQHWAEIVDSNDYHTPTSGLETVNLSKKSS